MGFFSQSHLSVQTLLRCPHTAVCSRMHLHLIVKDPVVHVRVRWIKETLKHLACTVGWVARVYRSWLFPGRQPEFPTGETSLGQYSCKKFLKKKVGFASFRPTFMSVCGKDLYIRVYVEVQYYKLSISGVITRTHRGALVLSSRFGKQSFLFLPFIMFRLKTMAAAF